MGHNTILDAPEGPNEYGQPSSVRLRAVDQVCDGCHRMLDCVLRNYDFADGTRLPFKRLLNDRFHVNMSMSELRLRDDIHVFDSGYELLESASAGCHLCSLVLGSHKETSSGLLATFQQGGELFSNIDSGRRVWRFFTQSVPRTLVVDDASKW